MTGTMGGGVASLVAPAFRSVPERAGSYADEVVDFAEAIGLGIDPEQADDLDAHCSFGPEGLPVAGESWELEGRQNGKTERVILPWTLFDFFVGPRGRIVDWTSHLMSTTVKTKVVVDNLVAANPLLSRRVKSIIDARGSEGIVLHRLPGEAAERTWSWTTRSAKAGRGGPADIWVADEGLFLSPAMIGARRPTLRSRTGAQVRGASSAGMATSTVLASVVRRGRAGDPRLVYVERCAPGGFDGSACELGPDCSHVFGSAEGCAMDREDLWHLANHAMARGRITAAKMRDERAAATNVELAREFGREGMGWHEDVATDDVPITAEVWQRFRDRSSRVADGVRPDAVVVAVRPDQSGALVALAGPRADGRTHLALIRRDRVPVLDGDGRQVLDDEGQPVTELLVGDRLVAEVVRLRREHKVRQVLVAPGPASRSVGQKLRDRLRATVQLVGRPDLDAAVASLRAGIREDDFRHRGDRIVAASLEAATSRRTSDGGWSIDTRGSEAGDELAFLVVALARWAARRRVRK